MAIDTYNLTYDEILKNIANVRKKHFLDNLTSPTFVRERVIMTNTKRDPGAIFVTNLASVGATKSTHTI